ncbi:MAG: dihydrolipoyl dehydrogenase [Bacteroidales bacterium]|nr:dihydrolipoyl dehydrogenase [Bacteroidales bacterium]
MDYDIIIIGAGPAGYVAAIRAGQLGLKTAVIEKNQIGGMCLNWGCIPSKAVIESAKLYRRILHDAPVFGIEGIENSALRFNWHKATGRAEQIVKRLTNGVSFLLKKNGVDIIQGSAHITATNNVSVNNRNISAKNIVIATGSYHVPIKANLPDGLVVELHQLFQLKEIPQNIVLVGESSIAVELAQMFNLIGKNVSLVVPGARIMPLADDYLAAWMLRKLRKDKINVIFDAGVFAADAAYANGILKVGKNDVPCDMVINSKNRVGIVPPNDINLEIRDGFVTCTKSFETNIPGIFAIGDVNGHSQFAHVGSAQGLFVVNYIKGIREEVDFSKYPMNMYSNPEIAQIGYTEQQLKEMNLDYKVSEFPLSANGKAMAEGHTEGFVRMLSEVKYGEVLGVQIVAPNATDMIAEAAAFMQVESTIYDVAKTIHAHPTISEVFMEAGFSAVDQPIHL